MPALLFPVPLRSATLDHFFVSVAADFFFDFFFFFLPTDRFRRSRRLRFILMGPPLPGLRSIEDVFFLVFFLLLSSVVEVLVPDPLSPLPGLLSVVAVFFLRLRSVVKLLLLEKENASPFLLKQLGPIRAASLGDLMRAPSRPPRVPA